MSGFSGFGDSGVVSSSSGGGSVGLAVVLVGVVVVVVGVAVVVVGVVVVVVGVVVVVVGVMVVVGHTHVAQQSSSKTSRCS